MTLYCIFIRYSIADVRKTLIVKLNEFSTVIKRWKVWNMVLILISGIKGLIKAFKSRINMIEKIKQNKYDYSMRKIYMSTV